MSARTDSTSEPPESEPRESELVRLRRENEQLRAACAKARETELALREARAALERQNQAIGSAVEQRNFVEELLNNLPAGLAYYGADLRVIRANPEYARLFNRTLDDVIGRHVLEIFGEPGRVLEAILARIVATGEAVNSYGLAGTYTFQGETFEGVWDVTRNPVKDASGRVVGVVVLMMDVTERERLARELEAQRALTERIVEYAPVLIAYADQHLIYRWNNPLHSRVFGQPVGAINGRRLADVVPPLSFALTAPLYDQVLATGEPQFVQGVDLGEPTADGRGGIWDFSYVPVPAEQGQPPGILIIGVDAAPRLAKERQQAEQIARLREVDQMKDQFLSILSHELRTPLNAIMGFASILDDEVVAPASPAQHEYLAKIIGGTEILLALINDLLDMSRLQAGKFSLAPAPIDFAPLLDEVLAHLSSLVEKKGQHVRRDLPPGRLGVYADRQRVTQVLVNLIGNAIKFTPEGGQIRVSAHEDGAFLRVCVVDNGIGIAATQMSRLFQPFTQVDSSNTRALGGAGLGLSIAKALIEAHGGAIGLESVPGSGSTFWFTLPLRPPAEPPA